MDGDILDGAARSSGGMTSLTRLADRFRDDCRGAALVELAMAGPVFAGLLIGLVDLGTGYLTKLHLEQAAQRAIEKVVNRRSDIQATEALRSEAATTAGVPEKQVDVTFRLDCSGTAQSPYDSPCPEGLIAHRYVSVSISKSFHPIFAAQFAGANADGTYTLIGSSASRLQ